MDQGTYLLKRIGTIKADENQGRFRLLVDEPYRPALMGLSSCTHAIIFWWADQHAW